MARPAILTPALRVQIIRDLEGGMGQVECGAKYGLSKTTVGWVYRDYICGKAEPVDRECDLSEEELEQLIAEQLPTMPREPKTSGGPMLPLAVSRGRGLQSRARRSEF